MPIFKIRYDREDIWNTNYILLLYVLRFLSCALLILTHAYFELNVW